jgi:hypothetical protein
MGSLLVATGLAAAVLGTWRGYAVAREALAPLVHEGEPTRTVVEAAQPLHARSRVRLFARRVVVAVGWLIVGSYGVFLLSVGLTVG